MIEGAATTAIATGSVIACHECDLLQLECPLPHNGVLRCRRCGAELSRNHPNSLNRALAFTLASIVLFAVGNAFPIVGLEVNGTLVETTLLGAASVLYEDGMWPIAGLVLATTFLMPVLQMITMTYLLVPLRFDRDDRSIDSWHAGRAGQTGSYRECRSRCGVVVVRRSHAVTCGRECRVRSERSLVACACSPG
jgi:uncharacterized paraquat-inducible protein A